MQMAQANVGSVVVTKGEIEAGNLKQENVAGIITERGATSISLIPQRMPSSHLRAEMLAPAKACILDDCVPAIASCPYPEACHQLGHCKIDCKGPVPSGVARRKQSKPSSTQESKQKSTQQWTTARSSADLTKPNQTARALPHLSLLIQHAPMIIGHAFGFQANFVVQIMSARLRCWARYASCSARLTRCSNFLVQRPVLSRFWFEDTCLAARLSRSATVQHRPMWPLYMGQCLPLVNQHSWTSTLTSGTPSQY